MTDTQWKVRWLVGCVALILVMISVGGITRMTRSGLSIVEWKPVTGILPPLTEESWQTQFELYQKSPEFNQVNLHFTLNDYKKIFFWEYFHRLLGRLIFFFIVIPGYLLWRRKIVPGKWVLYFSTLVTAQGLVGWLMVKSGLSRLPHVSPYMLALHFFLALMVLTIVSFPLAKMKKTFVVPSTLARRWLLWVLGILLVIQIFYGCLTSGLRAGFAFNTYPLMGGEFLPPAGLILKPAWMNLFENPATVQWIHRWIGALTLVFIFMTGGILIKANLAMWRSFFILKALALLQVSLGIANLLYSVPLILAILHQLVAALIVLGYFHLVFRVKFRVN